MIRSFICMGTLVLGAFTSVNDAATGYECSGAKQLGQRFILIDDPMPMKIPDGVPMRAAVALDTATATLCRTFEYAAGDEPREGVVLPTCTELAKR